MEKLTLVSSTACFGGTQRVYRHRSECLSCEMKFAIYLPPRNSDDGPLPVVYWLSGLTCDEQNFITKAGAQRYASELGLAVVCPDTSPRGVNIPGEDESYDFGSGAGFYLDATEEPWKKNYKMFSYVTKELPDLISQAFSDIVDADNAGISGHSMGGHGALVCSLKNPGLYKSVSAFAPICNPTQCPWGVKAFTGYLGEQNKERWHEWDACSLIKKYDGPPFAVLIHQGKKDSFYTDKQLLTENLIQACRESSVPCIVNMCEEYDHSYYFIATFIGEHLAYHAKILKAGH